MFALKSAVIFFFFIRVTGQPYKVYIVRLKVLQDTAGDMVLKRRLLCLNMMVTTLAISFFGYVAEKTGTEVIFAVIAVLVYTAYTPITFKTK